MPGTRPGMTNYHGSDHRSGEFARRINSTDTQSQQIRAMRQPHMALIDNDGRLQAYRKPRNERIAPMTTISPIR